MTNPLYGSLQGLAQGLLTSFGQTITVRRRTKIYNPTTGVSAETLTDYTTPGVVFPYTGRRVDGSLIKAGDLGVTVAAKDLAIVPDETTDAVVLNGREYAVVRNVQTNPAGVAVIYELQVRAGP